MVYKYGRYGKFLACPGYPECKNTKAIVETINEACPKCGGRVQIKKSKKGRKFYICENNPDGGCDYISWNKPSKENKENSEEKKTKAVKKTVKKTKK